MMVLPHSDAVFVQVFDRECTEDRAAFLGLPVAPFDACVKASTCANSMSLVRFERNEYSVPVKCAHQPVVVKGYVDRVVICRGKDAIAVHRRLWTVEDVRVERLLELEVARLDPPPLVIEVAGLRGEINGTLPGIDRNVEKIFDKLDEGQKLMHACHERTEVQASEIGTIFKVLNGKADKAANDEAHKRLWLFLRISLLAIATGALGVLVARAFGM